MKTWWRFSASLFLVTIALLAGCGSDSTPYTVTSLTPSEITAGSKDFTLLVSGSHFKSNTSVLFGKQTLPAILVNGTMLQVMVPSSAVANAGIVDVAVTGSPTSAPLKFTIKNPVPAVSSLSQPQVLLNSSGVSLDISGSSFVSTSTIKLGQVPMKPGAFTPTRLTVSIPDSLLTSAQVLNLSVENPGPGGGTSNSATFSVVNPVPTVAALSINSTMLNSTGIVLDVSGANFLPTSSISLGNFPLTASSIAPNHMTVAVPDALLTAAQVLDLSIANPGPGGGVSNPVSFTVLNPLPTISAISAEEAVVNRSELELAITGTGFAPGMKVGFGPLTLNASSISPTSATVVIPNHAFGKAAVHNVTVANGGPGGGTSNAHRFTVKNPAPSLVSLSIAKALVGSEDLALNLTGTGFVASESTIHFGPLALTPSSSAFDRLSVVIPKAALAESGTVAVTVTTGEPGGGQSNALEFAIENPLPTLGSLSLNSITAGSPTFDLMLTGTNFVQKSMVSFGGVRLGTAAVSSSQITLSVPAERLLDAGQYQVSVDNPGPGGGSSNAIAFTVNNPAPALTGLSPSTVIRLTNDTTLTLAGSGFAHQSVVHLGTSSLIPVSYTPTQISVLLPSRSISTTGQLNVSVENPGPGGGTSASLQIAVVNPQPHLANSSPSSITATRDSSLTLVLNGSGFNDDSVVSMNSSASGTILLAVESVEAGAITLSIPSNDITSRGTLEFTVDNPVPGGGSSETIKVVVHERTGSHWKTVVNNSTNVPGTSGQLFNSYNQPSISSHGTVVFKGQSKGQSGPTVGIYVRDMSSVPVDGSEQNTNPPDNQPVAIKGLAVPDPNNTLYNGTLAGFNQFPSFPRIDMDSERVAFRGQSRPVYTYTGSDGTESRLGSAGIYSEDVNAQDKSLMTGVGLLGSLPEFAYFKVPSEGGTRFDQFPGSPAIYHNTIVFKGNYTVGDTGKTGVYYRDMTLDSPTETPKAVQLIADSDTRIPNQPEGGTVTFGSTAPPSAAKGYMTAEGYMTGEGYMVFVGLDNEDTPTLGGIYIAPLSLTPQLKALIAVGANGTQVPGEAEGVKFSRLGEGLSFDGRFVGFWAAWGSETRTRTLICGVDGNQEMLAACRTAYPNGFSTEIPIHQGIFVYDTQDAQFYAIAKTDDGEFTDFLYWVFSGRPPNVGGGEGGEGGDAEDGGTGPDVVPEPPRWRSSAFVAVMGESSQGSDANIFKVAFKAHAGTTDGIYLTQSSDPARIQTVVDTMYPGGDIDSNAPAGSTITSVGLERDGLRNNRLVLTSSMLNSATTESNAGVYVTPVQPLITPPGP